MEARVTRGIETPFDVTMNVMVPVDASAEDIEQVVYPYEVGATRVTCCGTAADGTPDGSDRVLRLVDSLASG